MPKKGKTESEYIKTFWHFETHRTHWFFFSLCLWWEIRYLYTHQGDCLLYFFPQLILPASNSSRRHKREKDKARKRLRSINNPHLYFHATVSRSLSLHISIDRNLHGHSWFNRLSGISYEIVLAFGNVNTWFVIWELPFAFRFSSQVIKGKGIGLSWAINDGIAGTTRGDLSGSGRFPYGSR